MGIGAADLSGAIDRLASELLSQAERDPAIRITDHAKALDYFRARAAACDADSKSTAKPPSQNTHPPSESFRGSPKSSAHGQAHASSSSSTNNPAPTKEQK